MTVDAEDFRDAMRLTASGVTVVTTDGAAGRVGVTVSTLCSLSLEPPSVLLCIHKDSRAVPPIIENEAFAANVLAVGQQRVADGFAGIIPELREDRFASGTWRTLETGAPALEGALCTFDCRVASVFDFGSHRIIAGEVVAVEIGAEEPLVYSSRGYRTLKAA